MGAFHSLVPCILHFLIARAWCATGSGQLSNVKSGDLVLDAHDNFMPEKTNAFTGERLVASCRISIVSSICSMIFIAGSALNAHIRPHLATAHSPDSGKTVMQVQCLLKLVEPKDRFTFFFRWSGLPS